MSLLTIKSGILDSLQDTGRYGYSKWGINPSGAMDRYAAQVANALVGNELTEGVIEIHFPAGNFLFQEDALISICGANFSPLINSVPVPSWKAIRVKKNVVLSFQKNLWGNRCYLAVHGGIDLPGWLGSMSTHLKASAGGMNGRALKKGDVLSVRKGKYKAATLSEDNSVFPWSANVRSAYHDTGNIFFTEGNEWKWLTSESQQHLLSNPVSVDPSSDRMACYLRHAPVQFQKREELLSSGVNFGTIQALPSGNLVVLMADHQTTGGYPRIAHIITAHLPKLSQLHPLESFRLQRISIEDAEKMLLSLQQELHVLRHACRAKLDLWYAQH